MVAILRARVGLIEAALELWEQIQETTDNPWIRERAAQEIGKLRARRNTDAPVKTEPAPRASEGGAR
jgi:hypothetical protein